MNHFPKLMIKSIRNVSVHYSSQIPELVQIDDFRFLGFIKNMPHYVNSKNEVYVNILEDNTVEYVADWWDKNKMLWTDNPQNYRSIIQNGKTFFYDIDFKDAYKYDEKHKIVRHIGNYDVYLEKILFLNYFKR